MSLSYGLNAYNLIKSKKALPICGNKKLAFSNIEIINRGKKNKFKNICKHRCPKNMMPHKFSVGESHRDVVELET